MVADHYGQINPLRSVLSILVYPVQLLVHIPVDISETLGAHLSSRSRLLKENKLLREENTRLKQRTLKYEALEKENMRLRAFLDNSFKLGENVLVAELLSVTLVPYEHLVLVDKGSRFGIHVGQPVLSAEGVVGQVVRVSPLTSEILLITDPSHAIPVQVNRNGLRAIAVGNGEIDQLEVPNLPNNVDIKPGDLLVSSGLGQVFPPGYPVAEVVEVSPQPARGFAKVLARPKVPLDRIREVLITWTDATSKQFLAHPEDQPTTHTTRTTGNAP